MKATLVFVCSMASDMRKELGLEWRGVEKSNIC